MPDYQRSKWWVRSRPEPVTADELTGLNKPELAALAEAAGVDPEGTKAELVERLTETEADKTDV